MSEKRREYDSTVAAPLCDWCLERPVKPCRKAARPYLRGPRIINGVRYRWYCSSVCAGSATGRSNLRRPTVQAAIAQWRANSRRYRATRIIQDLAPFVHGDEVRMPIKELAKVVGRYESNAYARAWMRLAYQPRGRRTA